MPNTDTLRSVQLRLDREVAHLARLADATGAAVLNRKALGADDELVAEQLAEFCADQVAILVTQLGKVATAAVSAAHYEGLMAPK